MQNARAISVACPWRVGDDVVARPILYSAHENNVTLLDGDFYARMWRLWLNVEGINTLVTVALEMRDQAAITSARFNKFYRL